MEFCEKCGALMLPKKLEKKLILKCRECGRRIEYGGDLITAEPSVSGPRGIVPLGQVLIFCCEACLGSYYGNSGNGDLPKLPPRIP